MSTNASKTIANQTAWLRSVGDRSIIELSEVREVHVSLAMYPSLRDASKVDGARWTMLRHGKSFHWKRLDSDLFVDGLSQGIRDVTSTPAKAKSSKRQQIA